MWTLTKTFYDSSGIRTHEAEALHLKCNPFDRSGILSIFFGGSSGIRTHEAEALHLKCNPFDRSGILPFLKISLELC